MQKLTCFVMLLCSLVACRQAEMQTYRVPKESEVVLPSEENAGMSDDSLPHTHPPLGKDGLPDGHPPVGNLPPGHPEVGGGDMSMANAAAQGVLPPSTPRGDVTWVVPSGWEEKPGSGFRYATFVVPGPGGLAGDLSVTVLEGEAGGLLSNVNRWRGQIGLPELTEAQLPSASQKIRPAGRTMTLISFASAENLIDGKFKKRLTAVVFTSPTKTWFFKLMGEDRLVQSAEKDFLEFLESVKGL